MVLHPTILSVIVLGIDVTVSVEFESIIISVLMDFFKT